MEPLDPVEAEHRDIFLAFGKAAYRGSCYEMLLQNLLVANAKLSGKLPTEHEFEEFEQELHKSKPTMGTLLKKVRVINLLADDPPGIVDLALERRNFLIHYFFVQRAFRFATQTGRQEMIKELREIETIIYLAEKASKKTIASLASRMGITTEDVTEEAESIRGKERMREKEQ